MILDHIRGIHEGETIYVLGSGSSVGYLDPRFFDDKIVVATNLIGELLEIPKFYLFSHYHWVVERQLPNPAVEVAVTHYQCSTRWSRPGPNGETEWTRFPNDRRLIVNMPDPAVPPGNNFDPFVYGHNYGLVFGSSSVHGSIHLAAMMGARYIVLVGTDCGTIDDQHRLPGYYSGGDTPWKLYDRDLIAMKRWVKETYGTDTYSLNPFVNFNLEGHTFRG